MNYTISEDGKSITCHKCDLVSYHPMDVAEKFCGKCNAYHDDPVMSEAQELSIRSQMKNLLKTRIHGDTLL